MAPESKGVITLHSVTVTLGKGPLRKLVLDDVNWTIPPRGQYVLLGQPGSGKTTLLSIISGTQFPSRGWVEIKGSICPNHGLLRLPGPATTSRQLAGQLAKLYRVSVEEILSSATRFLNLGRAMDVPVKNLPIQIRRELGYALLYSIPFDFYLFDGGIGPKGANGDLYRKAFEARCEQAGIMITASNAKVAEKFKGKGFNAQGVVLHEGRLTVFATMEEALSFFETLPPPPPLLGTPLIEREVEAEEEESL
jgi:capsular polysaccharide transport system ATP-binding protein